ncbi:MAG: flagellar basal body L-ring protein FlgH [Pseudomonadota bacterium]
MKRQFPMVFFVIAVSLTACAPIGRPPEFSEIGSEYDPARGMMTADRAALSVPAPEPARYAYQSGSLWSSSPSGLLGDKRARTLGDILTVKIEINDEATINNETERTRKGSESASVGAFFGLGPKIGGEIGDLNPNLEMGSTSDFSGSGSVSRDEQLSLRVAATVVDVLPNGHLVIQGDQEVRVNNELRNLLVAGIVRPEDISRYNEINYDRIAGARISYGGRGQITTAQQPRWGQQVIDQVIPY